MKRSQSPKELDFKQLNCTTGFIDSFTVGISSDTPTSAHRPRLPISFLPSLSHRRPPPLLCCRRPALLLSSAGGGRPSSPPATAGSPLPPNLSSLREQARPPPLSPPPQPRRAGSASVALPSTPTSASRLSHAAGRCGPGQQHGPATAELGSGGGGGAGARSHGRARERRWWRRGSEERRWWRCGSEEPWPSSGVAVVAARERGEAACGETRGGAGARCVRVDAVDGGVDAITSRKELDRVFSIASFHRRLFGPPAASMLMHKPQPKRTGPYPGWLDLVGSD